MSKITNIGTALIAALYETNTKQEQLAKEMTSTQASISRLISGKNRPTRQTMNALCSALKKNHYAQAVSVLIGHLQDEVEASGMLQSDIEIHPARRKQPTRIDIEKYIDTVRAAAHKSPQTAALLADLAWLIDHADYNQTEEEEDENQLKVAQQKPIYNYETRGKSHQHK